MQSRSSDTNTRTPMCARVLCQMLLARSCDYEDPTKDKWSPRAQADMLAPKQGWPQTAALLLRRPSNSRHLYLHNDSREAETLGSERPK